jgi:hypothetical protein
MDIDLLGYKRLAIHKNVPSGKHENGIFFSRGSGIKKKNK